MKNSLFVKIFSIVLIISLLITSIANSKGHGHGSRSKSHSSKGHQMKGEKGKGGLSHANATSHMGHKGFKN